MSRIALVLPGNAFHANHLSRAMAQMDSERCGLPMLRKWGMPATVFFQGVDIYLKPWLLEEMRAPGSVEWGNAPFSHSFLPLVEGSWRDELDEIRMVRGSVSVTFFSEFYPPDARHIPTEYTLLLPSQSALYDWSRQGDVVVEEFPPDVGAIRFGGKVGILIREEWFRRVLDAFFLFQRYPIAGSEPSGRDCLGELIAAIRQIAEGPEERVVVVPIDLEAPWVGSAFGATVWEILCEEVHRQGLAWAFTPLSAHLEEFGRGVVRTAQPHRELLKWSTWGVQIKHILRVDRLAPKSPQEAIVKMIATGSDALAAWDRKIQESRGRTISKEAFDDSGELISMPITYNQRVIDTTLAACRSLERGGSFLSELEEIDALDDHILSLTCSMAERLGL